MEQRVTGNTFYFRRGNCKFVTSTTTTQQEVKDTYECYQVSDKSATLLHVDKRVL